MYTNVNGMRSARFPLQGLDGNGTFRADIFGKQPGPLGCNCTPMGPVGQDATPAPGTSTVGAMLPILALGALVIGIGVMASGGRKRIAANRRRR